MKKNNYICELLILDVPFRIRKIVSKKRNFSLRLKKEPMMVHKSGETVSCPEESCVRWTSLYTVEKVANIQFKIMLVLIYK